MKYYSKLDTNMDSPRYGQPLYVCRVELNETTLVSQFWSKKQNAWVDDPEIFGDVNGLGDPYGFVEIAEPILKGDLPGHPFRGNQWSGGLTTQASGPFSGIVYRAVNSNRSDAALGQGTYFTTDIKAAESYGSDVRQYRVSLKNVLGTNSSDYERIRQAALHDDALLDKHPAEAIAIKARERGYDAIYGGSTFGLVVFDRAIPQLVTKGGEGSGEKEGHPFRGNQWTAGMWSASDAPDAPWRAKRDEYIRHKVGPRPDGDYNDNPAVWDKYFEDSRAVKKEWERQTLAAVSEGRISPEDAKKNGLYSDDPWKPLPETLYHTTTAASAIEREGLRSRDSLAQDTGRGLGGGDHLAVSMTDSYETAKSIYDALLEGKRVLNGEITIEQMLDSAKRGEGARRSWLSDVLDYYGKKKTASGLPMQLDALLRGRMVSDGLGHPPNWSGDEKYEWHPATRYDEGWMGGDGQQKYHLWERDLTEKEKLDAAFDFYKTWITFREAAGGPVNPVFFGSDIDHLKNVDPKEIKILKFESERRSMGKYLGTAENEYRIYSSRAVRLVGDASHEKVAKGGAGSGEKEGHPFRGNQYTEAVANIPKEHLEGLRIVHGKPLVGRIAEYSPFAHTLTIDKDELRSRRFSMHVDQKVREEAERYARTHPKSRTVFESGNQYGIESSGDYNREFMSHVIAHEVGHHVWETRLSPKQRDRIVNSKEFKNYSSQTTYQYDEYIQSRRDEDTSNPIVERKAVREKFAEMYREHVMHGKFNRLFRNIKADELVDLEKGGEGSGEKEGHPFRGNQYTDVAGIPKPTPYSEKLKHFIVVDKTPFKNLPGATNEERDRLRTEAWRAAHEEAKNAPVPEGMLISPEVRNYFEAVGEKFTGVVGPDGRLEITRDYSESRGTSTTEKYLIYHYWVDPKTLESSTSFKQTNAAGEVKPPPPPLELWQHGQGYFISYVEYGTMGVNSYLRGSREMTPEAAKRITAMNAYFDKKSDTVTDEHMIVHRGISREFADKLVGSDPHALVGMEIEDKGFSSTSRNLEIAEGHATADAKEGYKSVVISIKLPRGTKYLDVNKNYLSHTERFSEEEELILRNGKCVVTGVKIDTVSAKHPVYYYEAEYRGAA